MKPSFGVFMHNPPIMIEDCDHRELADHPDFRIEATLGGHFVILQVLFMIWRVLQIFCWQHDFKGNDDEKVVKVANVKKDNYNINIMENFPMDIEIGPNVRKLKSMKQNVKQHAHNLTKSYPQMDLLFLCLVIGAVQEINAQQSGQSG